MLCLTFCLTACVSEEELTPTDEGGRLQLSLANINTTTTRATPAELDKPSIADFRLRIINTAGRAVYDDIFTEDVITLPTGRYDVAVSYGRNALMAIDAPYYIGTDNVEIKKNETTEANITARVGNALISVNFGKDAEELARFERYYSDYALQVWIDNNYLSISKTVPSNSIYVQAGSHVTLKFWGKLKFENDREVSTVLESKDLPDVLNAADHAIVTLSLPDPESALGVDISKVEVETVTLDETIPLSWLPVPTLTPSLQFDRYGELVGTLLTSNDGYPGMKWKAVVSNAAGEEVRMMQGTGVLTSDYRSSTAWPYLPQGTYKATYYIISEDDSASKASSREFVIPAPTGLNVTVTGYTSYSKYLEGDIEGANACDRLTIYEPSVYINISPSLLRNSHIASSFTYTYDGTTTIMDEGINSYEPGDMTGLTPRSNTYELRGDLIFDGVSVSAQRDFRITGLPYTLDFNNHSEWSETSSGETHWESSSLRFGKWATNIDGQKIYSSTLIVIPTNMTFCVGYNFIINTAGGTTTFTIKVGENTVVSEKLDNYNEREYNGTPVLTTNKYINYIECHNSWGDGLTFTTLNTLFLKYAANP